MIDKTRALSRGITGKTGPFTRGVPRIANGGAGSRRGVNPKKPDEISGVPIFATGRSEAATAPTICDLRAAPARGNNLEAVTRSRRSSSASTKASVRA